MDVVGDILTYLCYVDIEVTFDAICELFPEGANRRGAEASSRSRRASCGRDLDVWKQVGPYVQTVLVQKIRKMDRSHMDPASGWPMWCQGKMTIATRKYRSNFTVSKNLSQTSPTTPSAGYGSGL